MNKLRRVKGRTHIGTYNVDYLNIIACAVMIIYSSIDFVMKDIELSKYFLYIIPYLIYPVLSIIFRSNKVTAGLYLLIGFFTIALDPTNSGASGILYLYFSYNEIKSNKWGIALLSLSYIGLTIRFLLLEVYGSEAIVTIILFTFIFTTFYIKIIKDNTNMSKLPEEIKAILKLYCNGYTYQQISLTLGLGITPGTVRRKITSMMGKHNIKNDAQLGKWLHRNV
jgi:DNA-binding CsgD family transcriptional regulator